MESEKEYRVAYGESRKARKWKNTTITLSELKERLRHPLRTAETVMEYHRMKPVSRALIKDKGGFVSAPSINGSKPFNADAGCR